MSKDIELLQQVQAVDIEIAELKKNEDDLLKDLEDLKALVETLTQERDELKEETDKVEAITKDLEEKIRLSEEKEKSSENKMKSVNSEKELKALTKEISSAKKSKKQFTTELENLSEKNMSKMESLKEKEAVLSEKELKIVEIDQTLEENKDGWKKEIDEKTSNRSKIIADIKDIHVRRYDDIREKRGGLAVVAAVNEICQGCNINIPPQLFIDIQKESDKLYTHPHCHRIIYPGI